MVLAVCSLILLSFLTVYTPQKAAALGDIQSNFVSQACTNCAVPFPNNPAQGDILVALISDTAQTNLPTSVTDTLGNSFSAAITDNTQLGVAIYIANQTHVAGADTVTVNYVGAQTDVFTNIVEINDISSLTPSVTSKGSGTTANPISVTSVTPNKSDYCMGAADVFTGGGGAIEALSNNPLGVNAMSTTQLAANYLSFSLLGIYPSASTASTFDVSLLKALSASNTGTSVIPLTKWDYLIACLPASLKGTTTVSSTLTISSTVLTTATGTIFPEGPNTTDLLLVIVAIVIMLILFILALLIKRSSWFPAFLAGLIGLYIFVQLEQNQTIVYGSNSFLAPALVFVMIGFFTLASFAFAIYKALSR